MKKILGMKKTVIFFLSAAVIFAWPVLASAQSHLYKAGYQTADSVYGERMFLFDAKDDFIFSNVSIHNRLNFIHSENTDKARVDNYSRLSELLVITTNNFRVSALVRGVYNKDLNMADNFQYFGFIERRVKISGAYSLDIGLAFTDVFVYNRVYPGPFIFPVLSLTYTTPQFVARVGLPTLITYRTQKWSAGFSYTIMFNSKLFIKCTPTRLFTFELFTDTVRYQVAVGDPKKDEILNIFYAGIFLEASINFTSFTSFSLCGGYNIIERSWIGDQLNILNASQTYGSYKLTASLSFMF
ncbi:MAG: hypothetical protein FWG92_02190 [Leptospirales bacterium]|nr:hypothetical protein [Leptospirales bacterium]